MQLLLTVNFWMRPLFLLVLLLLFHLHSFATVNTLIVEDYSFENGLPHNSVYASMKDQQGMMWFATWYGLSCFDGVKFRKYNTRNDFNADIPPHKLQYLVEANAHSIWVKTIDHKLFLFDKRTESFYDVFNEIKKYYNISPKIIKIQKAPDGDLLMLTKNRDLLKGRALEGGKMEVTLLFDSQQMEATPLASRNLLVENQHTLNWIGTNFKIFSSEKGTQLHNKPSNFITTKLAANPQVRFTSAHQNAHKVWIGDQLGYLSEIHLETGNISRKQVTANSPIHHIQSLYDKTLLVALNDGIWELNQSGNLNRKIIPLLPGELISHSFVDSYDKVWFFVHQHTAIFYDPVNNTSKRFDLPTGRVLPSVQWNDGEELGMFVLTTSGTVLWIDRNTLKSTELNQLRELKPDGQASSFFHLMLDKNNILWLSSTSKGVFRVSFPKQQFSLFRVKEQPNWNVEEPVKALYQSKAGDVWVATRKPEVFRLNREGALIQTFSATQSFHIGNVYHIMEDHSGTFWFSTKGEGLVKAVPDANSANGFRFTRFTHDTSQRYSISGNEVYYTYQDSRGNIWVALFGGGLNLLKEEQGETRFYSKRNSFDLYPRYGWYMEVRGMVEDRYGRIWVGTSDGLMSFDLNFNHPNQIQFEIYRNESLKLNVLDNDIYFLFRDSAGDVWISVFGGGLNKLISYDKATKSPVFQSFSMKEGLNSDVVLSIVEDEQNYLWLATENAIARFDKANGTFRNFDRHDGFLNVRMEEGSAIRTQHGELWFGNRMGILAFNPQKIETVNVHYETLIVDFLISNREIRSFRDPAIIHESIRYAESITLKHHQNNFVIEFAALNYFNLNRVSYQYILEGFEDEWHQNGKNRIASYPNVPPGSYVFVVRAIDEANPDLISERRLSIRVLPPWWGSWWAYTIYAILGLVIAWMIQRLVLFTIRMRNDVYIEQKVSEMKLRFFTNISHELRTPLTLIVGPIQELKEKHPLNEKGKQYLALIEKSAHQMLQLVNQILEFRKLEHGKMILHVARIDLNKLVESFETEFSLLSEEKGIKFKIAVAQEEVLVWADKDRLEMVVRNLISNAFKFTESGGSIVVKTGLLPEKSRCFIAVEDTGVGVPLHKVDEIFERFTQAEYSKHAYYQGTGIGLHLCREIVSLHHGNIRVDPHPIRGSVFVVELQMGDEHFDPAQVHFYLGEDGLANTYDVSNNTSSSVETVVETMPASSFPLLLVVEDNKDLCHLLKMQLEDKYRVILAYNGREGLKKTVQFHPDLVITDIMMPEMNGIDMLQEIRKDMGVSHIPVVILTAKHNEEAKIQAISLGANAYITKPFSKEYLIARVEQLLNDRKQFRERVWSQSTHYQPSEEETYENYLVRKDVQLLEKIHQLIAQNIQNAEFNIDTMAEELGFSRSAFFKKLKSMTGLAPVDLIKEIRLNKSLKLLTSTDLSISEIAFEVGFSDAGYYGKCFRKKFRMTPTEYAQKNREKNNHSHITKGDQ